MPPYPLVLRTTPSASTFPELGGEGGVVAGSFVVRDFGEFHGSSFAIGREFGLGIHEARENGVAVLAIRGVWAGFLSGESRKPRRN